MAVAVTTRNRLLDRFELVLLLVLATIAVQGLVDTTESRLGQLFAHAISGVALIAAARASGARRRWRRAVDLIFAGTLLLSIGALVLRHQATDEASVPPQTAWLLAAALTPALIARRVLQHRVVTVQTIMGSVAAYLQIAVAYAFLFQTIDAFSSTDFFGEAVSTTVYMYFSVVTISTVGYGDFTAVTSLGRMASASEAVVGQVFLVTFVALIVSRFAAGMPRGSLGAPVDEEPAPATPEAAGPRRDQPGADLPQRGAVEEAEVDSLATDRDAAAEKGAVVTGAVEGSAGEETVREPRTGDGVT